MVGLITIQKKPKNKMLIIIVNIILLKDIFVLIDEVKYVS